MSRLASSRTVPAGAWQGDQDGELSLDDDLSRLCLHHVTACTNTSPLDTCPVCKTSRYLKKDLKFKVNPECYHRMCTSCVARIFSNGPNKCPIAGCHRTLRMNKFVDQTFEDIQMQREVDIRKRIAAIFNRREDDFESLDDYNDYLNLVEDMTYNIVNKIDVEATERKIAEYAEENAKVINANAALASQESEDLKAMLKAQKHQAELRRKAALREQEEERRAMAEGRLDIINRLASGTGDAQKIADEGQRVTLKKRLDKRAAVDHQTKLYATDTAGDGLNGNSGFVFKGLKQKRDAAPEPPFDAFGGLSFSHKAYHTLQEDYEWDWLDNLKTDPAYRAGGYNPKEFYSRALCEAFSGLGVLIGQDTVSASAAINAAPSTSGAGLRAKEIKVENPF